MSSSIRVLPDAAEAAEACGKHILILLEDAIAAGATPTLAISGGSSPKPMFEYFARTEFSWNRLHVFWVDERAVPPDHPQSNYKLAFETWLGPVDYPKANLHRIEAERFPDDAARRYVAVIREFFRIPEGEPGIPRFEVIHRGMGADAHTASLFPGERLIADHTGIAAPAWAPPMHQWRITLLPGVLEGARHTAILAPGADKVTAFNHVMHGPYDPMKYPAQIASREGSGAVWFIDRAALGQAAAQRS